jgi:hypothetical protein
MASVFLYVFIGFLFMLLIGAIVWLLIMVFSRKEVTSDNAIALNFLANEDSGFFLGEVVSSDPGKNNRQIINMRPLDVDARKEQIVPETVPVIVESGKMLNISKAHGLSKQKNITILLPARAEDLSGPLKDTLFGKGLMWMAELENFSKTAVDIVREGNTRKDTLLKEIGTGEISRNFLEQTNNLVRDYMENILSKKDTKQNIGLVQHSSTHE